MAIDQHIFVTADCLIISEHEIGNKVLLVKRKNDPYRDCWALPGGFVDGNEDLPEAASRELEEETNIRLKPKELKELGAYGKPDRDPRGRTVTIVYGAVVDAKYNPIKAGDDAAEVQWWDMESLPPLAFDHGTIVEQCFRRLI
ncbi:MAG: NUDIX hydrolase [Bacteroidota bacterium]